MKKQYIKPCASILLFNGELMLGTVSTDGLEDVSKETTESPGGLEADSKGFTLWEDFDD